MTDKKYMIIPSAMKKLLRIHGRVPLNYDEIITLLKNEKWNVLDNESVADLFRLVKAVEKAHGIGEKE
jgi:hypothetical protein